MHTANTLRFLARCVLLVGIVPSRTTASADEPVEAVKSLIEQARQADLAGDRTFYSRILAADFTLGTGTGEWETRESKLAYLGTPRHRVRSETISELRIRAYSGCAVATFRVRIEGEWEGEPFDATTIMTQVWVRQGGAWLLAASHGSRAR
jgi:hypothetical protein